MPAKAKVPTAALGALVLGLLLVDLIQVGVENLHPVKHDFDARSVDRDLLLIPLSRGLEVSALGCLQFVERTMILGIDQLGILRVLVIQNLQFHSCP